MMMMMKGKFPRSCLNKWAKIGSVTPSSTIYESCCQCVLWPSIYKDSSIPRDVPKGHLVVYVGEDYKRFVIKITLLKHPLFKALLDRAQDEYDFMNKDSKLYIPCDESLFLNVVQCAASPHDPKISFCFCS